MINEILYFIIGLVALVGGGGLLVSAAITLVLIPVAYISFYSLVARIRAS